MDKIDLHVHTTMSDGTDEPKIVVSRAAMLGLKAIAITDHDTMAGIEEAGETGAMMGVTIVPGIEISSDYKKRDVHVLGYFLDPDSPKLKAYTDWVVEGKERQAKEIIARLQRKGFDITFEAVRAENPDAKTIRRPHIAAYLVKLGVCENVKEAFRRYIGEGRSCYVAHERIPFNDAAKLIRECGGVAVLAHPLQYGFGSTDLETLVKSAKDAGFKGMEIYYSGYTESDKNKLFDLAEKYMLLPTGGSDYHGTNKPEIALGGVEVPAMFLIMLAQSQYQG